MGRYLSVPQWLRWTLSYPMLALDTQLPNACVGHSAILFTRRIVEQYPRSGRTPIHFRPPPNSTYFAGRLPTTWRSCGDLATALQVVNKGGDLRDAENGGSFQRYTNLTDADTVYASQQANAGGVNPLSLKQPLCRAAIHSGRRSCSSHPRTRPSPWCATLLT